MKRYNFYMVESSPWPILTSFSLFFTALGGVMYMHFLKQGLTVLLVSLARNIEKNIIGVRSFASYNGSLLLLVSDGIDFFKPYKINFIPLIFVCIFLLLVYKANNIKHLVHDIKDFFKAYKSNFSKFDPNTFLDFFTLFNMLIVMTFLFSLKMDYLFCNNVFLVLFFKVSILNAAYHILISGVGFYSTIRIYSVFIPIIIAIYAIIYTIVYSYLTVVFAIENHLAHFITAVVTSLYLRIILSNKLVSIYKTADFQAFFKLSFFFIYFFIRIIFDSFAMTNFIITLIFPIIFVVMAPLYAILLRNVFKHKKLGKNKIVMNITKLYFIYLKNLYYVYINLKKMESNWKNYILYNVITILLLLLAIYLLDTVTSTTLFLSYYAFNMLVNVNAAVIISMPDLYRLVVEQLMLEKTDSMKEVLTENFPAALVISNNPHIGSSFDEKGQFTGAGITAIVISAGAVIQNQYNAQQVKINLANSKLIAIRNHINEQEGKLFYLEEKEIKLRKIKEDLIVEKINLLSEQVSNVSTEKIKKVDSILLTTDNRLNNIDVYKGKIKDNIDHNKKVEKTLIEQYPGLEDLSKASFFTRNMYPTDHIKKQNVLSNNLQVDNTSGFGEG